MSVIKILTEISLFFKQTYQQYSSSIPKIMKSLDNFKTCKCECPLVEVYEKIARMLEWKRREENSR